MGGDMTRDEMSDLRREFMEILREEVAKVATVKTLLTQEEAAHRLSISVTQLKMLIRSRRLSTVRVTENGHPKLLASEVEDFVKTLRRLWSTNVGQRPKTAHTRRAVAARTSSSRVEAAQRIRAAIKKR
jgi:hypothetical protein